MKQTDKLLILGIVVLLPITAFAMYLEQSMLPGALYGGAVIFSLFIRFCFEG